jgi:hypothetical protein
MPSMQPSFLKNFFQWTVLLACAGGLLYGCNYSDWAKRSDAAQKAAQLAEETPHVIRTADGCSVYKFMDAGNPHYFTRCKGGEVTTESDWDERSGKQVVHKSEVIATQEEN